MSAIFTFAWICFIVGCVLLGAWWALWLAVLVRVLWLLWPLL